MNWTERRERFRALLAGKSCVHPGSVYDAISARIAEDLGFEVGIFSGSIGSMTYRSQSWLVNATDGANWFFNVSYVTGAHSFKAGYASNLLGDLRSSNRAPHSLDYRVNNGVPNQLTV